MSLRKAVNFLKKHCMERLASNNYRKIGIGKTGGAEC